MSLTLKQAEQLILSGDVIAVPTETVYGLACSIKFPKAIKKIFEIKGRPNDKPLNLLIASSADAESLALDIPENFYKLQKFMPGPITVVLKANKKNVPAEVRVGFETIGLRVPNHSLLLKLLKKTGPLAAPSANPSNKPAAKSAQAVLNYFGKDFPVLDGGICKLGVESTIVKLDGENWEILRQGAVSTKEMVKASGLDNGQQIR